MERTRKDKYLICKYSDADGTEINKNPVYLPHLKYIRIMSLQSTAPVLKYPVGTQDFAKLRRENNVYIDKTALIYDLTRDSNYIFLSRPRRFGKSLLCSTLQNYFEGRRELFQGLAIEQLEHDWTVYPVIHLSLSRAKNQPLQGIVDELNLILEDYEAVYGRNPGETSPGKRLFGLIKRAYAKTGKPVVVIIDEYDAPLLYVLHQEEMLHDVRELLQEFYSPLKDADPYLRFCFITGITKFSQLSIFSTINNLINISMMKDYATLCGITEGELHQYLHPGVEVLSRELECSTEACYDQLKEWYDGYHFTDRSEDIYNPFSLLYALRGKDIESYWFETATPTYLTHILKKYDTDLSQVDGIQVASSQFNIPTEAMDSALPVLYQSGYLTIKGYDREMKIYRLGIPNEEVRVGLAQCLLPALSEVNAQTMNGIQQDFCRALLRADLEGALTSMRSYFAALPYPDGGKKVLEQAETAEWHYSRIFFMLFSFMNRNIHTEVRSARGRADMVMYTAHTIYVFEFKVNHSAEEALKQIDEQGYMIPYEADSRKLVKCGVSFSSKLRTLKEWKIVSVK